MDAILTPVSIGELIDKITILEIKAERIDDAAKLSNVRTELDGLLPLLQLQLQAQPALAVLKQQLKAINERMWDIQDQLRDKEAAQVFDDAFIQLARGVYGTNGERVQVKNEINRWWKRSSTRASNATSISVDQMAEAEQLAIVADTQLAVRRSLLRADGAGCTPTAACHLAGAATTQHPLQDGALAGTQPW